MPKFRKKQIINQMKAEFSALSVNEGLSRSMLCAMVAQLDIPVDALADVRCAVSEAVTNAIVHGYGGGAGTGRKTVYILCTLYSDNSVKIIIRDRGCGIADIEQAMQPLFTTDTTGERSGMGFSIMKSFMDTVRVRSVPGRGTTVELRKRFSLTPEPDKKTSGRRRGRKPAEKKENAASETAETVETAETSEIADAPVTVETAETAQAAEIAETEGTAETEETAEISERETEEVF